LIRFVNLNVYIDTQLVNFADQKGSCWG